ncbi:hypothetical protein TNCV_543251 [Trichonephila clavipes]|nr:hypothetical protein TNCV_543251 [Trichonephila clavipes]
MATPGSSFTPTPLGYEDNIGVSVAVSYPPGVRKHIRGPNDLVTQVVRRSPAQPSDASRRHLDKQGLE